MGDDGYIADEEELYRSVRGRREDDEYYYDDMGNLVIRNAAFKDRHKEPSVDRAKFRNFNPSLSKLSHSDGIVSLITKDVRAIGDVKTPTDQGTKEHAVDVIYNPIPGENEAHSQITVDPAFCGSRNKQDKAFKLLRIALARLATRNGWTLPP